MAARHRDPDPDPRDHSDNPRDYYFHVVTDLEQAQLGGEFTEVYFTSASYFDREGAQSDWHVSEYIGGILEEMGLGEEAEGMCTTERTPTDIRAQLLAQGFLESQRFSEMLRRMTGLEDHRAPQATVFEDVEGVEARFRAASDRSGGRRQANRFDRLNEDAPPVEPVVEPPKATAYDRLLADEVIPGEKPKIPATTIEIDILDRDPRKVSLTCDTCGTDAIYAFKAAKRLLGCCGSSGCMKPILPKLEQWAIEAQSKSWGLLADDDLIPEKPQLSAREEILEFQKTQKLPETGDLDTSTEEALRKTGRVGMISIWRSRLRSSPV